MQQWFADHPWVVWIGLGAVLAIAEMLSLDLVLLMFALGALAAAVVAGFGVSLWLSVLVFAFVSGLLLLTVRKPLTHKLHDGPTLPTGYSELIGMRAEVVQRVDPRQGRVVVQGDMWTARTSDESEIPVGEFAVIARIDGATLIVQEQ